MIIKAKVRTDLKTETVKTITGLTVKNKRIYPCITVYTESNSGDGITCIWIKTEWHGVNNIDFEFPRC